MCGIFGVIGVEQAAELTYLGLYALQHRGQESAGIVSIDADGHASVRRDMGLVSEIFPPEVLGQLPGSTAIGHTRYSTTGSSVLANAQPAVVNYHHGALTLAAREPEDQIIDALERVEGAYTLLLSVGTTVYAIVDPRGFRPLVLGRLGDGWVLASETCALDIVGAVPVRELEPGEWLKIENGKVVDLPPLKAKPHRRCVFELIYFSRPDSVVFGESVDRVRRELGRQLAREHPAPDADCVFSVPDSSNAMALGYSEESEIDLEHGLIRNHYVGRTFINPGQTSRTAKVRIKFNPVKDVIAGKRVVVVDDSIVRGTTSRALMQMIRQAGAREVHMRIASHPITGSCLYGIDTPRREELIAATHSVEEIRQHLGVDTLGYLSLEGMLTAAGSTSRFCHACFSGDYPTEIPGDQRESRSTSGDQVTALID
jgi:amidophosphoribosyltransferase